MKVRLGHVTNSSSVSYIITMNRDMADCFRRDYERLKDQEIKIVEKIVYDKLLSNGTRVMLEGKEIYTIKLKFETDECMFKDSFDTPIEEIDFNTLDETSLWAYIYGEYIINSKICFLKGYGKIQVETY